MRFPVRFASLETHTFSSPLCRPAVKPTPAPKAVPAPPAPPAETQPEPATTIEESSADEPEQSSEAESAPQEASTDLAAQALDQPEVVPDQEPKPLEPVDAVPELADVTTEQEVEAPVSEPAQTTEAVPETSEPSSAVEPAKDPWSSETQNPVETVSQAAAPSANASAYNGPPGLNPAGKASATQPIRTSSRTASRFTDGQAVVMPGASNSGAGLDMQFGSLSFGNAPSDPEPV